MATLNSLFTTHSQLLVDSSFSPQIYSIKELQASPPHVRALVQDSTLQKMRQTLADSGVQMVLTNTYDMSRFKLAWLDCADRCAELNTRAVQMTRQALGTHGQKIVIAGNIGAANAHASYAEMVNGYAEQAEGLAAGGADCLWLEGFKSVEELEAALAGCAIGSADLPIIATISLSKLPRFTAMLHLLDTTAQVVSMGIDADNGLCGFHHVLAAIDTVKPIVIKGDLNALTTEFGMKLSVSQLWQQFSHRASQYGARIIAGDTLCNSADLQAISSALTRKTLIGSFS